MGVVFLEIKSPTFCRCIACKCKKKKKNKTLRTVLQLEVTKVRKSECWVGRTCVVLENPQDRACSTAGVRDMLVCLVSR